MKRTKKFPPPRDPDRSVGTKKPTIRLRPSLFWDVDPKTIDLKRHAQYVIERVLDFGNDREVRWMMATYSPRSIRNTVKNSRVLHAKSKALWSLLYP